ncbi:hypothetical protein GQ43DRAFT_375312 [Delitschia confertaspora ATCC 74209]|uniref:Kelch repeat protein n=1 Tax=Delitschia confertaspora ATCC 74209 TaxID=1513339 RepID=A0A9P4JN28_9PLEO|nr:hypothetical protein GQ43DRAFT_375312 [Delitschia confertaspora ATCC 74209]
MTTPTGPSLRISAASIVVLCLIPFLFPDFSNATESFAVSPVDNFCARWFSSSIIRDEILYIDGGIQNYKGTNQSTPATGTSSSADNWLIKIPLSQSWDWKSNIVITGEPKNESNPRTGTTPPSLIRGTMFHGPANSTQVFAYGGSTYMNYSSPTFYFPDSSTYALWSYDYDSDGYPWAQHDISMPWKPNHGLDAEAVDQGLAFYLNGQIDWGTSQLTQGFNNNALYTPLDGMVVINLVDQTSVNISTPGLKNGPRVGGKMQYIDEIGNSGILVAIGGEIAEKPELADPGKGTMLSLATVDVFDIDSYLKDPKSNGTWYQQNTTGQVPEPRIDFCLTTVAAPDNSSFHIYLYGGYNPTQNNTAYDDVYILSLPAFHWTKVFINGATPRYGHDCHLAGKRQMLTLGGNITNFECDWEAKGIAVLDMSTITWGSVFLANETQYQVPQRLLGTIGGTVDGGATQRDPKAGWTDKMLKNVFAKKRNWDDSNDPALSKKGKKTNTRAIIGGVIGGVIGLVLLLALLYLVLKKRKRRNPHELPATESSPLPEELANEKKKYEMPGVNDEPAELPGPEAVELHAPRQAVEAPHDPIPAAAELPGTNVVQGGLHGIPHVRTPGDDLPELPVVHPGLRKPPSRTGMREVDKDEGRDIPT